MRRAASHKGIVFLPRVVMVPPLNCLMTKSCRKLFDYVSHLVRPYKASFLAKRVSNRLYMHLSTYSQGLQLHVARATAPFESMRASNSTTVLTAANVGVESGLMAWHRPL